MWEVEEDGIVENRAPDNGSTWRIYDAKSAQKNKESKKEKKKKMGKVPSPLASSNFNKLQMI